ncbi:MAG: hypothetical protein ACP5JF_00040 [Candidatus Methanodesulfokora sp.]|jgi:hypothetical protein
MVTEPLEALIAIILISIILASIFIYNQRGTENIMLMRTLTRSIAGTVAGMYANYTNSSISFYEFNSTVNEFLDYVEKKENVSIAANITVVLKNGTLRTARLRQMSRPVKRSITENITLFLANESRELHVYALPFRRYVYCDSFLFSTSICISYKSIYIYVVGYYSDGTPATSGSASATADRCFDQAQGDIRNGIVLLELDPTSPFCSGTVKVEVSYTIDGKSGIIPLPPFSVQQGSGKGDPPGKEGLKSESQCGNEPCYLYFLGEIINLTTDVSQWKINGTRGSCPTTDYGSGNIPTASGLCDSLPRYIFFAPGPYNLSMNRFSGSPDGWDTHQPFFIEPYFTIISVRVGFNR